MKLSKFFYDKSKLYFRIKDDFIYFTPKIFKENSLGENLKGDNELNIDIDEEKIRQVKQNCRMRVSFYGVKLLI